jgi:hypothetical protein
MRLEAITTNEAVILSFTGEGGPKSVALRNDEARKMTVPEAIKSLLEKLMPKPGVVEVEIVDTGRSTQAMEFELVGDEDDEDLSMYEEVIESPYMYLKDLGVI